jgi:chitin disaccharide deacetylase
MEMETVTPRRSLIVNADDLGRSAGINLGIIEAHERGIVTSASLMVRWPAAPEAASYARGRRGLAVGLHLDFGEWARRGDAWVARYEVVPTSDAALVRAEVTRQVDRFRELMGRGPTHIDSHQHVHRSEPVRAVVLAAAAELGVHVRHFGAARYCGAFYGQDEKGLPLPGALGPEAVVRILRELHPGLTELCCHPGYAEDLDSDYRAERTIELRTLCSAPVREALDELGIRLVSFASAGVSLSHEA